MTDTPHRRCYVVQDFPDNAANCESNVIDPLLRTGRPVLAHGGEHPEHDGRVYSHLGRRYAYSENVQKFADCIRFLLQHHDEYDAYWLIEHDCYVRDPVLLDSILSRVECDDARIYGTLFRYPDHPWIMGLPYVRMDYYMIGASVILTRKSLEMLGEFVESHASQVGVWQQSCDFFLSSFIQRREVPVFSIGPEVQCGFPGLYRRFDLWQTGVALYHKIDEHRLRVIDRYANVDKLPPNKLSADQHFLSDLDFESSSGFGSCGTGGKIFADDPLQIFFSYSIDTDQGVGVHAPTHLFVRTQSSGYYSFGGAFLLNGTARQDVRYYVYLNGARTEVHNVRVAPREVVPFELFLAPGLNTVIVETAPTLVNMHNAHSCLQNPVFRSISQEDYVTGMSGNDELWNH